MRRENGLPNSSKQKMILEVQPGGRPGRARGLDAGERSSILTRLRRHA